MSENKRNAPSSFHLRREGAVLVVIDVQQRLQPVMAATRFEQVTLNIKRLLIGTNVLEVPAIVTEQYPDGLGPTIATIGEDMKHAHRVTKMEFDAGKNETFNEMLETLHARTVILTGIETHICVAQTAITLLDRYDVWVARDAVCSRTEANIEAGLALMNDAGAILAPTESILFGMLERAGTPEFKAVSKIVK